MGDQNRIGSSQPMTGENDFQVGPDLLLGQMEIPSFGVQLMPDTEALTAEDKQSSAPTKVKIEQTHGENEVGVIANCSGRELDVASCVVREPGLHLNPQVKVEPQVKEEPLVKEEPGAIDESQTKEKIVLAQTSNQQEDSSKQSGHTKHKKLWKFGLTDEHRKAMVLNLFHTLKKKSSGSRHGELNEKSMLNLSQRLEEMWYKKCKTRDEYLDGRALYENMKTISRENQPAASVSGRAIGNNIVPMPMNQSASQMGVQMAQMPRMTADDSRNYNMAVNTSNLVQPVVQFDQQGLSGNNNQYHHGVMFHQTPAGNQVMYMQPQHGMDPSMMAMYGMNTSQPFIKQEQVPQQQQIPQQVSQQQQIHHLQQQIYPQQLQQVHQQMPQRQQVQQTQQQQVFTVTGQFTGNGYPVGTNPIGFQGHINVGYYPQSQVPVQQQPSVPNNFIPVSQPIGANITQSSQTQFMSNGAPVLLRGSAGNNPNTVTTALGMNVPSASMSAPMMTSQPYYPAAMGMDSAGMVPLGDGHGIPQLQQQMIPISQSVAQAGSSAIEQTAESSMVGKKYGWENLFTSGNSEANNGSSADSNAKANARKEQILKQQRWLLFLRHCAKCTSAPGECQYKNNCAVAKALWDHLVRCKDPKCTYPRCSPSRALLKHHQECRSADCPVCAPVKQYVSRQRDAMLKHKLASSGFETQADQEQESARIRARRVALQAQLASRNAEGVVPATYSQGDLSAPIVDPQAEKKPRLMLQENMGTSLLEYFRIDEITKHLQILSISEPQKPMSAPKKAPSSSNLELLPLVEEESQCKCCHQNKLTFEAPALYCYLCGIKIKRNQTYWASPKTCDIRATWCHSCISNSPGPIQLESFSISRDDMERKKNDAVSEEAWVQCDNCEGWVHQICGMFNKGRNDDSRGFLCPECLLIGLKSGRRTIPTSRPQAMLSASDLPRCRLSDALEERINKAVEKERINRSRALDVDPVSLPYPSGLTVRVVNNVVKKNEVKPRFAKEFCDGNTADAYLYKQKVVLLFQHIDGVDMCLFCMYIQEYGDDCPAPNNRSVYLSYLDSVKYFQPDGIEAHGMGVALRTFVYHELLLAYMEDAKTRGFCSMYIWACPPLAGDDYILYCHPGKQKVPRSDRLREWYLTMLRRSQAEKTVVHISNLFDMFFEGGSDHRVERPSVTDLPYLEGDYWPGEAENLLASGNTTTSSTSASGSTVSRSRKVGKDKRMRLPDGAGPGEVLMAKLGETIQGMKADFLVAQFYESCSHCRKFMDGTKRYFHPNPPPKVTIKSEKTFDGISLDKPGSDSNRSVNLTRYQLCEKCYQRESEQIPDLKPLGLPNGIVLADLVAEDCPKIPPNSDNDPTMDSEFFDTRHQFLSLCQGNHYQFDSLRRARHSSMMVLYHLHNPSEPAFSATCNICQGEVPPGQGYRCQSCPDFDMCQTCYANPNVSHPHPLVAQEQKKFDETRMRLSNEDRKRRERALQETMKLLVHAFECQNPNCTPNCAKIKALFRHAMSCKTKVTNGCQYCRRVWMLLQTHSKLCTRADCPVPRCRELREIRRRQAARQEDKRRAAYRQMLEQQHQTSVGTVA